MKFIEIIEHEKYHREGGRNDLNLMQIQLFIFSINNNTDCL